MGSFRASTWLVVPYILNSNNSSDDHFQRGYPDRLRDFSCAPSIGAITVVGKTILRLVSNQTRKMLSTCPG